MKKAITLFFLFFSLAIFAQKNVPQKPNYYGTISSVEYVTSIQSRPQDLIPSDNSVKEAKDKRSLGSKMQIGEDPQKFNDYFVRNRHKKEQTVKNKAASLVFDAYASGSQPTDPSLAVGPNHVMVVYNTGFTIYDKSGNQLVGQTAPNPAIFPSGGCCDLTVSYDNAADRWVLTFLGNGAQIAVSDGPNPVTAGWYVYNIAAINDYQKLSIWSDGYYITDNTSSTNKVWALERDAMLVGDPGAQILGFNLPGISTSGFYSPQAFNVTDSNLPAPGGAPIVYLQDNAWGGVSVDHVKLWTIDVDWNTPANSTISAAQEIITTPFISVFDGGSFSNLTQPGGGTAIDALQATIMNQAQFRKFATHNSAVFNFVVDTDSGAGELAGIRWMEFRQSGDNQPWSLYQEGTYTAPNGRHAWNGSLAMDGQGNIGMGYTSMSGPSTPGTVQVSSYFTGRLSTDPLNTMTMTEELIANGNANIPGTRYGDYGKIDVDPSDNQTFWHITEYMNNGRKGVVGRFVIQPGPPDFDPPTDPTNLVASNITGNGATLNWTASTDNVGVTQYNISIDGNVVGTSFNTTYDVTGLAPLTTYTASVTAQDAAGNVSGSASTNFTTIEGSLEYCTSTSTNINDEYIGRVQLNTIDNPSGGQFYTDFTGISTTLDKGTQYTITVTPTWTGTIYPEAYAVWIDYNKDGDFTDAGEEVWSQAPTTATPVSGSFTIPAGAVEDATRMRVSMKYNGLPTSCETFTYGEVEDYTVVIQGSGPDVTPPVITLIGPPVVDLTVGDSYTDQGATASDNVDGDITANIVIGGDTVDTNTIGTYIITYNVSDAAGNAAAEVTRTVNVNPDTTPPVITLIGPSVVDLIVGDSYTDQGATASDNVDGDISANIVVGGDAVDTNTVGTYIITYNVSDAAGNAAAEVTRTVNVSEPSSGCSGGITAYPYSESFENTLGAWTQATGDDLDWTVDSGGTPSSNTGPSSGSDGSFYIYVEASGNGTGYPNKRAIINSPCFDLGGLTSASFDFDYHMYGSTDMGTIDLEISTDEGANWTSIWNQTGNQGNQWLSVSINLNAYTGGGVQLRFNRVTGGTWQADIAIDNINLTGFGGPDTTAPVITLNGASTINLEQGDSYVEQGATATDNVDGDITANIVIGGDTVDTNTVGTYVVTYNVSDAAGNAATEVTRTVNVAADTTPPVITLIGSAAVDLIVGDPYIEQGATAIDNFDGDISANIVIGGATVDTNLVGVYIVTYNVSDAAGNAAVEVTRTVTVSDQPTDVILHEGFFETGWDGWIDGGSDSFRYSGSRSFEGIYSIQLRDNTNTSTMTLNNVDVSPYDQVEIDFYFYPNSMENNEDFWLQYNDGTGFTTVAAYASGTDFTNDNFYNATVTLDASQFNLVANAGFRFRCDASGNGDRVYIDQVTITGKFGSGLAASSVVVEVANDNKPELVEFSENANETIKLYPNPANSVLNIDISEGSYDRIMVISPAGRLIETIENGSGKLSIDVSKLASGMYFVRFVSDGLATTKRFVKN